MDYLGGGGRGGVRGGGCLPEYLAGEEGDWLLLKMVEVADRTSGLQAKPFSDVQSTVLKTSVWELLEDNPHPLPPLSDL